MTMTPEIESALTWARECGYNTVSDYPSTAIDHVHTLAAAVRAQQKTIHVLMVRLNRYEGEHDEPAGDGSNQ